MPVGVWIHGVRGTVYSMGARIPSIRATFGGHAWACPDLCAVYYNNNNNNNNSHDNVYGAVIMTEVIARVHPVHLMNVD